VSYAELAASELSRVRGEEWLVHCTITSGAPCRKSTINSSRSPRRLMSRKPPLCRRSGKSYHKNTSTRRWRTSLSAWLSTWLWLYQWWSLRASAVTLYLRVCILICSSHRQQTGFFRAIILPARWKTTPHGPTLSADKVASTRLLFFRPTDSVDLYENWHPTSSESLQTIRIIFFTSRGNNERERMSCRLAMLGRVTSP